MTSFSQNIHLNLDLFYLLNLYKILNRRGFLKHYSDGLVKRPYKIQKIMFLLLIFKVELIFLAWDDDFDAVIDMKFYLFCDVL